MRWPLVTRAHHEAVVAQYERLLDRAFERNEKLQTRLEVCFAQNGIAPNDPEAQRRIAALMRSAQRRGIA